MNILVCTDFSKYSTLALKRAEDLRQRTNGQLNVLHVSEHRVTWDWLQTEGLPERRDSDFEADLMNTLQSTLTRQMKSSSVSGEALISVGVPAPVIIEEVITRKIDLIVLGHRGRTGYFSFGSLAQKIVATSPVPVLVVKHESAVNKIAGLVDPNEPMDQILEWSEKMAALFLSTPTVVSLFADLAARFIGHGKIGFSTDLLTLRPEEKTRNVQQVKAKIKQNLSQTSRAHLRVEVSTEKKLALHLAAILEEEKVDLAVMKRHQSGLLEKILIGSETRRMLDIFSGDLLILPPH